MKNKTLEKLLNRNDKGHPKNKDGSLVLRVKNKVKKDKKTIQRIITIQCGDCDNKLIIYPPLDYEELCSEENRFDNLIEINGVIASMEEWRSILLPILNIDYISNDKKCGKYLKLKNV